MAYPQELINEVLDYLDSGHSVREAERRFGVGHESAARWRRLRDGNLRANRPHPVKYPQDTVRLALGLAYGGHVFGLDEVAVMVGVSAPTISNWKRRCVEGGHMTSRRSMLMYGKEASNRKQEIDRQHYTIPNQRPKDKHFEKI